MALPIPALALGGAALLALLLGSSSSKADAGKPAAPGAPGTPAKPGSPALPGAPAGADVNDPAMRKKIHDAALLLAQNGQDPDAMDQAAAELEKYGFTTEAALLHARANQLRLGKAGPVPQPPSPKPPSPLPAVPDAPPAPPPAPPAIPALTTPKFAVVTTSDPAPSGDLYIVPSPGAPGIPGVGAEKDGTVTVLNWNATPDYAHVAWAGGSRLGPVTGFAKKKYLVPSASAPLPSPNVVPVDAATMAKVTTSSPSPDGDLIIRESMGGRQIGGALKDSLVKVLEWNAGSQGGFTWSKIEATQAAQNWPAATGYAKQQYLKPQPTISGMARTIVSGKGRAATVLAQGGVRMWARAGGEGLLDILPYGTRLELVKLVPGRKADPRAKGPGGWALVRRATPGSTSAHTTGWVPSETLAV